MVDITNFKQWTVCHLSFFMTFVLSGIVINIVQLCLFILIGWWHRSLFRKLNYYLVWMIYSQLLFLVDWWSNSEMRMYVDPKVLEEIGSENAVIVANHHYELDWLFGWMVADRHACLGNARVFVKKILKYVPVVGWAWNFSDVAFLERNLDKDSEIMKKSIEGLSDYPDPVWLLIFAEGTRMNPEKLEASRDFARSRNLPVLRHCLTPRTKGFSYVIKNMDSTKFPTIYDVTLAVHPRDGGPATISSILLGRKTVAEAYIRKYNLADVPKDFEGSAKFLMDVYKSKDELIDNYALTGKFSNEKHEEFPLTVKPRRIYSLINTVCLNLLVVPAFLGHIGILAFSGSLVQLSLALVLVVILYIGLKKFIGLTKISKGSAYGQKQK